MLDAGSKPLPGAENGCLCRFLHRFRNLQRIPTPARRGSGPAGKQTGVYLAVNLLVTDFVAIKLQKGVDGSLSPPSGRGSELHPPVLELRREFKRLNVFKLKILN